MLRHYFGVTSRDVTPLNQRNITETWDCLESNSWSILDLLRCLNRPIPLHNSVLYFSSPLESFSSIKRWRNSLLQRQEFGSPKSNHNPYYMALTLSLQLQFTPFLHFCVLFDGKLEIEKGLRELKIEKKERETKQLFK